MRSSRFVQKVEFAGYDIHKIKFESIKLWKFDTKINMIIYLIHDSRSCGIMIEARNIADNVTAYRS